MSRSSSLRRRLGSITMRKIDVDRFPRDAPAALIAWMPGAGVNYVNTLLSKIWVQSLPADLGEEFILTQVKPGWSGLDRTGQDWTVSNCSTFLQIVDFSISWHDDGYWMNPVEMLWMSRRNLPALALKKILGMFAPCFDGAANMISSQAGAI